MPPRNKTAADLSDESLDCTITVKPSCSRPPLQFRSASTQMADKPVEATYQPPPEEKTKPASRFDKYKDELKRDVVEEYETPHDRDSKAILLKKLKLNKILTGKEDVYLGQNYYKSYLSKEDTTSTNATSQKYKAGPMRLSSTNRISCRFDFRPDVCKDYKETGSCGFGDSCIYIHDRGDYKSGWQLDEEWEPVVPSLPCAPPEEEAPSVAEEPIKCPICNDFLKDPVVTKCSHVFCQTCAMKHFRSSEKDHCFTCKTKTSGLFRPYAKSKNAFKLV